MKINLRSLIILLLVAGVYTSRAQVVITTAGSGVAGYGGDGGPATAAILNMPSGVVSGQGSYYIADRGNSCLRKVSGTTGNITNFAGSPTNIGFSGDNGPATAALMSYPISITISPSGDIYFCDSGNACLRKVSGTTGLITTVAGKQSLGAGFSGEGGPATAAQISNQCAIAVDASNNIYIADGGNSCLRKVSGTTGLINTIAGMPGAPGFGGDNGPATAAQLNSPVAIAIDSVGDIIVADAGNSCLRKVSGTTGTIITIAGTPLVAGYSGDNGSATSAQLSYPCGLAIGTGGKIFVSDMSNNVIRVITATGTIKTAAGTGVAGFNGDGSAAVTQLNAPRGLSLDSLQNCYMADLANNRIRYVDYQLSVLPVTPTTSSLKITPNPGSGNFKVRLESPSNASVTFSVFDILGKKVKDITGQTNHDISLDLAVPSGLYMVHAESGTSVWDSRIVVTDQL